MGKFGEKYLSNRHVPDTAGDDESREALAWVMALLLKRKVRRH